MTQVLYRREALRSLKKLPLDVRTRIREKIGQLADAPQSLSGNVKKLKGRDGYRLRVGDWRVIYEWQGGCPVILVVLDVGPRGRIYD